MNRKQKILWTVVGGGLLIVIIGLFYLIDKWDKAGYLSSKKQQTVTTSTEEEPIVDLEEMEEEKLYGKKQIIELDEEEYYYRDDIHSYLIIGTDASGNQEAESEEYRGAMADFLMLVVVNHTDKSYAKLQINRDTMAEVTLLNQDGTGEATAELQICTSHWYGGTKKQSCKNTVRAVSQLLGNIKIDAYYALDMKAIGILNHAVGGVTVPIENDFSKIDPEMKQGSTMSLTDEQAYYFVQTRYGVDGEDNASRMVRQQTFLGALTKQVEPYLQQDSFAVSLYKQLQEYSTASISGDDVNSLIQTTRSYKNKGIYTIDGEEELGQALGDGEDHVEYYIEENSLIEVMQELYHLQQE